MNSKKFYDIAISVAKEAGSYQKEKFGSELKIEFKGAIDLVTEVDKKSEQIILNGIQDNFPEHDIMAEEGGGERKDSAYKWIVDPLDGTTNFAHRLPLFAVSIALEFKGKIIGGVVYNPIYDELFCAFKGEGAYLNNKKIKVTNTNTLDHAMIATGFAYNLRKNISKHIVHFQNVIVKAQAVRRLGSAAIDICYLACGRFDGFWELNLFPWDTAAGTIIAEEAGALVSRFDGSPYTVYEKDLLITNSKIHAEMIKVLKKGMSKRLFF